jgi:hypothetical protein
MTRLEKFNLIEFAAENYRNPACLTVDEFFGDIAKFKYVKRLLNRYERTGVVQERLLINHLILIYNVFDSAAATEILFNRCEESTWPALKSCLLFLNRIENHTYKPNVSPDKYICKKLENL